MANTNNFKAFALDPNANVMSQEGWEALPALLAGFSSGKASSAQVNKAIRQATTIAALVGQFIANSGVDALDNGDVSGLVTKFTSALKTNLTLGTASTKDIGTGTNQVPDMNSFTSANNWFKLPSGYIVQFFSASFDTSGSYINFPTPFASRVVAVIPGTFMNSNTSNVVQFSSIALDTLSLTRFFAKYNTGTANLSHFIAIGK
ncbi:hypothetical protein [Escherichia coli]|uniref:gp53-like domain-containing protein n=1 Tax=Escherichia coli TaxID=562 RepID=UPI001CBF74DD|nr:hypothetical protein [Escherichia coli]MCK3116374.1 hypothetical protein [Escherichia coli]MCV5157846.1 hypothetical protein [Escherichia coli]MCV5173131.1 hypothetical protein [Escherichia coli]MCV5315784.1 hypothetical protein [Escherichia coli]